MMFNQFLLLVCLGLCGFVVNTKAQNCVPNAVQDVEVLANKTLQWSKSTNCDSTYYVVNIRSSGSTQYEYQVVGTSLNVDFLPYCGLYTITIVSVANHILGAETSVESTIAPPLGANITIKSFTNASVGYDSLLRWEIDSDYELCVEFYHIIISDFVNSAAIDTYSVSNTYLMESTGACAQYVINITAVYLDTEGPVSTFRYNVSEANLTAPRLQHISTSPTSINTTWTLEPYFRNRCNITSLYIDGGSIFNLTVPIYDTVIRPPVYANITGLQPSTVYLFRVTANNTAGLSAAVPIAVQTDGY